MEENITQIYSDIGQWAALGYSPWEKKNSKAGPIIALAFCLESLSRLQCKCGAAQEELGGLADLRREIRHQGCWMDLGLQDTQYWRRGSYAEKDLHKVPGISSSHKLNTRLCMWGQDSRKLRRETCEGDELNTAPGAAQHWESQGLRPASAPREDVSQARTPAYRSAEEKEEWGQNIFLEKTMAKKKLLLLFSC